MNLQWTGLCTEPALIAIFLLVGRTTARFRPHDSIERTVTAEPLVCVLRVVRTGDLRDRTAHQVGLFVPTNLHQPAHLEAEIERRIY